MLKEAPTFHRGMGRRGCGQLRSPAREVPRQGWLEPGSRHRRCQGIPEGTAVSLNIFPGDRQDSGAAPEEEPRAARRDGRLQILSDGVPRKLPSND